MAGLGHWYVELRKQAFWRGVPHTWVNRYIMSGVDPSAADATTVIAALHDIENQIHLHVNPGAGVGFVTGKAYSGSGGAPFATVNYNPSLAPGSATGFAGASGTGGGAWTNLESCLVIETRMQGLSSHGKPVFNRKYIRGWSYPSDDAVGDTPIPGGVLSVINAAVAPWKTGVGSGSWVVIGKDGRQAAAAPTAIAFTGNRQVPKGRKRKTTLTGTTAIVSALNKLSPADQFVVFSEVAVNNSSPFGPVFG